MAAGLALLKGMGFLLPDHSTAISRYEDIGASVGDLSAGTQVIAPPKNCRGEQCVVTAGRVAATIEIIRGMLNLALGPQQKCMHPPC
jgi:hypothetical protein